VSSNGAHMVRAGRLGVGPYVLVEGEWVPFILGGVDNTLLNAGTGGDTIATDDIGGVKHQLVKVEFGAADSATPVSAANPLPTEQIGATPAGANAVGRLTGTVSAANSTSTPLGIGGVFTGTFEEVKDYGALSVIVFADQIGAVDGLEFQWSSDGTNADRVEASSVLASSGRAFSLTPRARYFRVKYTNGGVAQTVFRLGTVYHPAGSGIISRPLDQALNDENFAQTVRAILDAQDTATDFQHLLGLTTTPTGTEFGLLVRAIATTAAPIPVRLSDGTDLSLINAAGALSVDGSGVTQPVSAVSLPLPAGASTAALQTQPGVDIGDVTVNNAAGAAAVNVQDGGNSLTVDQATATSLKAEVVGPTADNAANPTAKLAVLAGVANAAAPTRTEGNVNPLRLNLAGDAAVTLDGEAVVLGTGAAVIGALTGNQSVNVNQVVGAAPSATNPLPVRISDGAAFDPVRLVEGDIAHDAINTSTNNPVLGGAEATSYSSTPSTAVASGDRTKLYADRHGVPFFIGGHPDVITLRANYTAVQTDTAIVTIAGGQKIAVTSIEITADNANTVDVAVRVGFGAVNTPTTTGVVASHPGIKAGGGFLRGDGSGLLGVGADGEDLRITSEVPSGGSIDVVVTYFLVTG